MHHHALTFSLYPLLHCYSYCHCLTSEPSVVRCLLGVHYCTATPAATASPPSPVWCAAFLVKYTTLSRVMFVTVSVAGPAAASPVPTCCHSPGGTTTSTVAALAVTTGTTSRSSPTRNSSGGDIRL
ncbi:hypothetical protein E2C01_018547 [Portunus trituberculatus]|uniref:Secreted protein n=1 Tax=Portunus trituberculatus TaxID=210409 RepID=A0A5B7DVX3_PORTR|nr:hypothetical protein [Portunus trituberculatus]